MQLLPTCVHDCVLLQFQIRLQKEANRRIEDLASKAHYEAVANLDERTKTIYKENASMVEALSLHMSEEESLRRQKQDLEMANRQLAAEKELSQQLAQNKIQQGQKQKKHISDLEGKVSALEQSLTVMVREFEKEREDVERKHRNELLSSSAEITTLSRQCQLQKRYSVGFNSPIWNHIECSRKVCVFAYIH